MCIFLPNQNKNGPSGPNDAKDVLLACYDANRPYDIPPVNI